MNVSNTPDNGCWSESSVGFYISLAANAILAVTTIISEAMGTNRKSDKNGILDSFIKMAQSYQLTRTNEEDTDRV